MQFSSKRERTLARALGLCTRCGDPLPEACAFRWCEKCRAVQRPASHAFVTRRRKNRRQAGLCIRCGEPSDGRIRCRPCADEFNAYQNERNRRIREGTWQD